MSLARPNIRSKAYLRIPKLGFARTADSVAADGIVDAVAFTDSVSAEGIYSGAMIYRPLAASANQLREAGDVSSTKLLQSGLAYSGDAAVLGYEVVGLLHPDNLNDRIRLAQRRVYFENKVPISLWTDGDFASALLDGTSGSYDWVSAATSTTPTKSTVAGSNESGFRNLILTGAGYVHTSSFYVNPGDRVFHGAASKVSAASVTSSYTLLDVTHGNVPIGAVIQHNSMAFQTFFRSDTIPEGCYEIQARFQTSGGVATWDTSFGHLLGVETGQLTLPSTLSDRWRLLSFGPAEYGRAVGVDRYNSSSRRIFDWGMGSDYEMFPLTEEANPYYVQINRAEGLGDEPYWIHWMRPFSDICDLTDETTTTNAPEDLLMAAVDYEISDYLYDSTEDPKWGQRRARMAIELAAQRQARGRHVQTRQTETYVPGGRGGGGSNPLRW